MKLGILNIEEVTWRHKRWATWLAEGYQNSKIFHSYANQRRVRNSIWEITDADGNVVCGHNLLREEAVRHFQNFDKDPGSARIMNQLEVIQAYLRFFTETEGR